MRPAPDERVQNVPAIKLADRNQVECRDENPNPAGEQPRIIAPEGVTIGNWAFDPFDHPAEDQRHTIVQFSSGRIEALNADLMHSNDRDRQGQSQAGERPADGDVEHALAIGDTRALKDDGAHRSEGRDRKGNKIGKRRRHFVPSRLQIVSHLVRDKNRHHGAEIDRAI